MAESADVMLLRLPAELVRRCAGFSYDIGGSVMKIAFRSKEDYDEAMANQEPDAKANVRLVMFARPEMDKAIDFILNNAYITRPDGENTVVYTTGVGGFMYRDKMEKLFKLKIVNIDETDCFHFAFKHLFNEIPRQDLEYPLPADTVDATLAEGKALFAPFLELMKAGRTNMKSQSETIDDLKSGELSLDNMFDGFRTTWTNEGDPSKTFAEQDGDPFPMAIGFFGSAFGLMKVDKDWNFIPIDVCPRGGRLCLALASLILECDNFEEFIELARKGNSDNIDYCSNDIQSETMPMSDNDEHGGFYSVMSDFKANFLAFSLGKAVGKKKSDFKREDLAAAILRLVANDMSYYVDKSLNQKNFCDIKHIFIGGGFPANDLSRSTITRELTMRAIGGFVGQARDCPYQAHFLKQGPYLGCVGGLLNSVEHFVKPKDLPSTS